MSKNQKRRHFDKYGAAEEKPSKFKQHDNNLLTVQGITLMGGSVTFNQKGKAFSIAGGWDWVDIVSHLSKGPNKPEAVAA